MAAIFIIHRRFRSCKGQETAIDDSSFFFSLILRKSEKIKANILHRSKWWALGFFVVLF